VAWRGAALGATQALPSRTARDPSGGTLLLIAYHTLRLATATELRPHRCNRRAAFRRSCAGYSQPEMREGTPDIVAADPGIDGSVYSTHSPIPGAVFGGRRSPSLFEWAVSILSNCRSRRNGDKQTAHRLTGLLVDTHGPWPSCRRTPTFSAGAGTSRTVLSSRRQLTTPPDFALKLEAGQARRLTIAARKLIAWHRS
jgi:hypothetical protein